MQPSEFLIRPFQPADHLAVEEITFRTGFQGEDLTGRGYFDDRRLFYTIFIAYYTRFEPEHFFVAQQAKDRRVMGFIGGSPDTQAQQARFWKKMPVRIALRAFLYTSWRYPRTFRNFLRMLGMARVTREKRLETILTDYPAHLHINVLPGYQGRGVGGCLINHFELHLRSMGVTGLHLQTSNHNTKAVPFYKKMGFEVIWQSGIAPHPLLDDLRFIAFGKQLGRPVPSAKQHKPLISMSEQSRAIIKSRGADYAF